MNDFYCEVDPAGINCLDKPYANFHYGIRWKPTSISGKEHADGYIVQNIMIEAPSFLTGFHEKKYFEAWRVKDGCVVYEKDVDNLEDDIFSYPEEGIAESINKSGRIIYHAKVYWVDNMTEAFEEVDKWSRGTIIQAGMLKSSLNFKLANRLKYFNREDFVFDFSFTNEEVIQETFLKIGRSFYSCDRKYERKNFDCYYRELFEQEKILHIFEKVIEQLEFEFNK